MTLIALLRHGEVKGGTCFRGSTDDPLSDTGLAQMHAATKTERHWDHVITSPLQRCAVFARHFTRQHALPLSSDHRFQEMHFGRWEGRTAADIFDKEPEALNKFWTNPGKHSAPGGESLSSFQHRVVTAWNEVMEKHAGQRVLIVTHGGVIRLLLCYHQQRPIEELLQIEVQHGALFTLQASCIDDSVSRFSTTTCQH